MSTKTRSDNSGNEEVVDIAKGGDESRGRKCHVHDVIIHQNRTMATRTEGAKDNLVAVELGSRDRAFTHLSQLEPQLRPQLHQVGMKLGLKLRPSWAPNSDV
jgi:hypothetical protein